MELTKLGTRLEPLKKYQHWIRHRQSSTGKQRNEHPYVMGVLLLTFATLILTHFTLFSTAFAVGVTLVVTSPWLLDWYWGLGLQYRATKQLTLTNLIQRLILRHQVYQTLRTQLRTQTDSQAATLPFVDVMIDNGRIFQAWIWIENEPASQVKWRDDFPEKLSAGLRGPFQTVEVVERQLNDGKASWCLTLDDYTQHYQQELYQGTDVGRAVQKAKETGRAQETNDELTILDGRNTINWRVAPHMIISGRTGTGKTTLMGYLMAVALTQGYRVAVCDPKRQDFARLQADGEQCQIAREPQECLQLLKQMDQEMAQRMALSSQHPGAEFVQQFVMIDELAALRASLSREEQRQLDATLKRLVLQGRAFQMHLVIGIQQANAQELPTEIREQLGTRVLLGNSTPAEQRFLFTDGTRVTTDDQNPYQGLCAVNGGPVQRVFPPYVDQGFDLVGYCNGLLQ